MNAYIEKYKAGINLIIVCEVLVVWFEMRGKIVVSFLAENFYLLKRMLKMVGFGQLCESFWCGKWLAWRRLRSPKRVF